MEISLLKSLILILIITFLGCSNFELPFPISDSSKSIFDPNLVGNWIVLDENDSIKYPILHVEILKFNNHEYLANCRLLEDQGRNISTLLSYKVFSSNLNEKEFLNLQSLNDRERKFIFYRIENKFADSIHIRVITDSLKTNFKNSNQFSDFLKQEDNLLEKGYLSNIVPFYRWNSLKWDNINKVNKSTGIENFILCDQISEKEFIKLSTNELKSFIQGNNSASIQNFQNYFSNINLVKYSKGFWKVPKLGVIKMKSGKLIKVKYDSKGTNFLDISNNRLYVNRNTKRIR